ncbi:MAG: hypothetical protein IJQ39_10050 [Thermoguttaceae bacterium]|nr:hypothetical protein [Thermoguttaceae bacterium]
MSFDFGSLENKKKSSSAPGKKPTPAKPAPQSNAPNFDFSNLGGSPNNTQSSNNTPPSFGGSSHNSQPKPSGKPLSGSAPSKKTPSKSPAGRAAKGKKGSLIKGVDNTVLFAGIGGGVLLILVVAFFLLSGGSDSTSKPVDAVAQRNKYINQAYELVNKHEYEKAIAAYEKAYKADPNDSYATDQISIIYRNNLHDEEKAEYWKNKSEQITSNRVDSSRGASAQAYEERAEKIKKLRESKKRR